MPVKLNHTIVNVRDKRQSADFLTELFGPPPATPFYHFLSVDLANQVTLDFCNADYGRIQARGIDYWADPGRREKGAITRPYEK